MAAQNKDFYDHMVVSIKYWLDNKGKKNKFSQHIKWAPEMFKLACQLSLEKAVILEDKAKFAVTVSYFISPFDMFPEALAGVIGYADDLVLLAYVLKLTLPNIDKELLERYWKHDEKLTDIVNNILNDADEMIGKMLFEKLKSLVDY